MPSRIASTSATSAAATVMIKRLLLSENSNSAVFKPPVWGMLANSTFNPKRPAMAVLAKPTAKPPKPGVCKLSFVNKYHRHWLCFNSRKFEADERNMPHDMDEFLALMAPRYLYVASASEDVWAGPEGEQFAAEMASGSYSGLERLIEMSILPYFESTDQRRSFAILSARM